MASSTHVRSRPETNIHILSVLTSSVSGRQAGPHHMAAHPPGPPGAAIGASVTVMTVRHAAKAGTPNCLRGTTRNTSL